ncbi:MAG: hypothetical protein JST84_33245 [Acidobacteria bacterium]|nr:hypothetical protein [Acidobacteriota bacterium]
MIFEDDFPLLVSAHAIQQFQDRIAPMSNEKVEACILGGIRQAANIKLQPDGHSFRVRTRRPFPFEFRAYCVFDPEKLAYVVTTIVKGDSNVTRKHKRKEEPL